MENQYDHSTTQHTFSDRDSSPILILSSLGNSTALTIRDLLVHEGYFIHVVLSVERAVPELLKHKPKMLILMNEALISHGASFIKQVKQLPELSEMVIVVMSSTITTETTVQLLNNGVDDIVNPYQPRVALAHIKSIFRRKEKRSGS